MSDNLKHKAAIGTIWLLLDRVGQQVVYLIVGIILARVLAVDDYALVGMLNIFVVFSTVLIDSGFATAIIREKSVDDMDYSTVFVFNIAVSLIIYIALFSLAPQIATFFKRPELLPLSRIVFIALPINALGIVQTIMLARQVNFKLSAAVNFSALIISGVVAIVLALLDFGVWALASQIVLYAASKTGLLWINNGWRISFRFQFGRIKKYLSFSTYALLTGLLNAVFSNVYAVAIGRRFSGLQMGYYTQANKFADIPYALLNSPIQNVVLSSFSQIQDDKERLRRAAQKSWRTLCFMVFPVLMGAICIARPLFLIVLGLKWEPIIPYFQLVCLAHMFASFAWMSYTFLNIKGYSNINFYIGTFSVVLLIIAAASTIRFGITTMLGAIVVVRIVTYAIHGCIAGKKVYYPIAMQIKDALPYLVISSLMAVATYSWKFAVENMYLLLILQVVTGALVYIIANEMLGSTVYREAKQMALDIVLRKVKFKKK